MPRLARFFYQPRRASRLQKVLSIKGCPIRLPSFPAQASLSFLPLDLGRRPRDSGSKLQNIIGQPGRAHASSAMLPDTVPTF